MAEKIKLISDSGSDLRDELLGNRDIDVLPMIVTRDDDAEFDANIIDLQQMYSEMKAGSFFKTAQVNLDLYIKKFEKYTQEGYKIICVTLSSGLSSTYSTAVLAAETVCLQDPSARIEVIDSKSGTVGYGCPMTAAYDMLQQGAGFEELTDYLKYAADHIEHIFTVQNLDTLFRGGRLTKTAYTLAVSLNIRPILEIDSAGSLTVIEKVRGEKKIRHKIASMVAAKSKNSSQYPLCIVHSDAEEAADEIRKLILEQTSFSSVVMYPLGAPLSVHVGCGMMGFIFINPDKTV